MINPTPATDIDGIRVRPDDWIVPHERESFKLAPLDDIVLLGQT